MEEKELILMQDHLKDIGADTKRILKILIGNGELGLITKQELHSQSLKRLWLTVRYVAGGLATVATAVTVKVFIIH